MQISLTPDLEHFVDREVHSGRYQSASEVVREALYVLQDRERAQALELESLRQKVMAGVEQLDQNDIWTLPESPEAALREIVNRGKTRILNHSRSGA